MLQIRGKNLKSTAYDIADGYVIVNPLFFKPLDKDTLQGLYKELLHVQTEIRSEKFPYNDIQAIRMRNMKLQRLHSAAMILRNFARERRLNIL